MQGGTVEIIGLGLLYGLATIGPAIGIGLVGAATTQSMARQPEMAGKVQTIFILSAAFVEALALLGFVLALILQGKVPTP
jgi:F-type H+-transporting ATPase subunit c